MGIIYQDENIIRLQDVNGDLYVFGYNPETTDEEYIIKAENAKQEKINAMNNPVEEDL